MRSLLKKVRECTFAIIVIAEILVYHIHAGGVCISWNDIHFFSFCCLQCKPDLLFAPL